MTGQFRILCVDDEKSLLKDIAEYFDQYSITCCSDPLQAIEKISTQLYDIIITDFRMPGLNGLELLLRAKKKNAYRYGIIMTAFADKMILGQALNEDLVSRLVEKPLKLFELDHAIHDAVAELQRQEIEQKELISLRESNSSLLKFLRKERDELIGINQGLRSLFIGCREVAKNDLNVLVYGETGTGKELIARSIHYLSQRRDNPFIVINCAAIPENLFESELFGHIRGAFSGAIADKPGKIELADKGTLFLDEIGELDITMQAKLLRVLEDRTVERVGSNKALPIDFRLICATNRDLQKLSGSNAFRQDLYYRLQTQPLHVPPLRERTEDIPELVEYYLNKVCLSLKRPVPAIDIDLFDTLAAYSWPGNIRELENAIVTVLVRGSSKKSLDPSDFQFLFSIDEEQSTGLDQTLEQLRRLICNEKISLRDINDKLIQYILAFYDGNVSEAVKHSAIKKDRFYQLK